jgi:predicted branched-subunit amino acid permease
VATRRRASLYPIGIAVALDGVAFGVLSHAVGFGPIVAIVFSALAISGSAQFAALSIVGTGGGAVSAGVTALLLNARAVPMGLSVAPLLRGRLWWRALTAQLVFDESWALGDPKRFGIDAVFPAFFLALLAPFLASRRGALAGFAGAAIALALTPVAPRGLPILAASLGCLVGIRR